MGHWTLCYVCVCLFITLCVCQGISMSCPTIICQHFVPFVTIYVLFAEYCGMKEPVSDKLCVSLRLPWQFEPIYFCTGKSKHV